jgi:hypothetical protein
VHSEEQNAKKRRKAMQMTMREVCKLSIQVTQFRDLLAAEEFTGSPEQYEKQVRTRAERIETEVYHFKQKRREQYQLLAAQESKISEDLAALQASVTDWEATASAQKITAKGRRRPASAIRRTAASSHQQPQPQRGEEAGGDSETARLQQQLAELQRVVDGDGGHNGGWRSDDHDTFLKLVTQVKNQAKLIKRVAVAVGKSPEAVTEHVQWYRRRQVFQRKKRALLAEWKASKEETKEKRMALLQARQSAQKEEQSRVEALVREQRARESKEQVQEWKLMKQKQEAAKRKLEAEQAKLAAWRKRQKEKAEREKMKTLVLQYHKEQEAQQRSKEEVDEDVALKRQIKRDNRERARLFRERQQAQIDKVAEERLERELKMEQKKQVQRQRILSAAPEHLSHVTADRSRLTRPTKSALSRQAQAKKERGRTRRDGIQPSFSGNASRAVPSWRQGM